MSLFTSTPNNGGEGYEVGDTVDVVVYLQNPDTRAFVDPGAIACTFTDPDGVETVLTYGTDAAAIRDVDVPVVNAIRYRFRYTAATEGNYRWTVVATGSNPGVVSGRFSTYAVS